MGKDRTISSIRSSSPLGPGPLQVLGTNGFITGIAIIDERIAAQASSVKLIYTDGQEATVPTSGKPGVIVTRSDRPKSLQWQSVAIFDASGKLIYRERRS